MGKSRNRRRRAERPNRRLPTLHNSTSTTTRNLDGLTARLLSLGRQDPVGFEIRNLLSPYRAAEPVYQNRNLENKAKPSFPKTYQVQPSPVRSLCDARRERKEVMFASGNAGRRGQKAPVWTNKSRVRCK